MTDVVENTEVVEDQEVSRIPEALESSPIFAELCKKYLAIVDEISAYNDSVLKASDSEWTLPKVMAKAKELSYPEDPNIKPNAELLKLYKLYEKAVDTFNRTRKAVQEATAEELGITLSATSERDPEKETSLKEERKTALSIGTNLNTIAGMLNDDTSKSAIIEFLASNEVPAVGRNQSHSLTAEGSKTPKYRVTVSVFRNDEEVLSGEGFTKTALALPKFYERGKNPVSADTLRTVWEKAGNTPDDPYKVSPVEFFEETGGLKFVISKK